MIEMIDNGSNRKMMAMVLCSICYQNDYYLIYAIQRNKEEANLFVSKLIKTSEGYISTFDFENGEKEVLDKVIQRILNKESREFIENDNFIIIKDIKLGNSLVFDIDKCYVSTVSKTRFKDCLIFYELVTEKMFDRPIVEVVEDERKFNEGFASNIVLIVFGMVILVFSAIVIYGVIFG